ncbi:zinc finger protein [Rhodotorula toruloides]|uniref:Transcription factor BYE1 n=1 Tax=Rhodotorula toruloides TaxID=5286 RepID=A0A511K9P5_RHOTO|nr:zinc finger protein [Rhodotorula toruloides]
MVGGRQRKPTARALDAAESRLLVASLSRERPRAVGGGGGGASARPASPATPAARASASTTKTTYSPAAAPVKKNGRAQNARGKQAIERETGVAQEQVDEEVADGTLEGSAGLGPYGGQQDLTLYCVCLGYDTGEQPMIQCEHCSNWFHFRCVGLTDQVASQIEAYSCDMCEQMGMGTSRMLVGASTHTAPVTTFYNSKRVDDFDDEDEPFEDEEEDEGEPEPEDDEDFEEDGSKKRGRKTTGGKGMRRKREIVEESSDDYDSDEDDEAPKKRRRPSAPTKRSAGSQLDVKPSLPPPTSVPPSDKTRSHVVKQLTSIFSSIYAADATASDSSNSTGIEVRSAAFAEEVEGELFEGYAEPDDKNVRGPRAKYSAKFRSLHYNLKSNAYLRSRVAANELTANKLVNLTAEDLQTPELRAMAESVRAASLRNSVKEVLAAPTAKRTHKGEEEIESEAKLILEAEEAQKSREEAQQKKEADRQRSNSVAADSPGPFAGSPAAIAGSPVPRSPGNRDSPSFFPTTTPRHRSSLVPGDASPLEQQGSPALPAGSPKLDELENDMSPPPAPSKPRGSTSSFDMSSIWGKVKAASPTPTEEPKDAAAGGETNAEDAAKEEKEEDGATGAPVDEDFEDDLFRDPNASPEKRAPAPPPAPALSDLPPVWAGDLIVPEEGGFPAFAIQVGGRPVGSSLDTWTKLLPRGLTTAGRLPTAKATKYLIECALAPTRELIVAALMPDTTGPSADFPHKPTKDSCLAKHQHIVDTYVKRDRVGVVQPQKELAKLVKDIYIVPLRRDASVPEYVELADEHCLPDKRRRTDDLVLAVLVVQKGALPTVKPPPLPAQAPPPPPPVASAPPMTSPPLPPASFSGSPVPPQHGVHGFSPPPPGFSPPYQSEPYESPPPPPGPNAGAGFDPAVMQSLLSQVDPNTINNLLANPSLLNNLPGFGGSPAPQQPPPPPMHPGYAAPPPAMQGYAPPPPAGYGYPPPPPTGPAGGGGPPVHLSRLAMMGTASPPDVQYGQQPGGASPGGYAPPGAPRDQGWGSRRGGYGY